MDKINIVNADGSLSNAFEVLGPNLKDYYEGWDFHKWTDDKKAKLMDSFVRYAVDLLRNQRSIHTVLVEEKLAPLFREAVSRYELSDEDAKAIDPTGDVLNDEGKKLYTESVREALLGLPIVIRPWEDFEPENEGEFTRVTPEQYFMQILTAEDIEDLALGEWDKKNRISSVAAQRGIRFNRNELKLLFGLDLLMKLEKAPVVDKPSWMK